MALKSCNVSSILDIHASQEVIGNDVEAVGILIYDS